MKKKFLYLLLSIPLLLLAVVAVNYFKQDQPELPVKEVSLGESQLAQSLLASLPMVEPTIALNHARVAEKQIAKMTLEEKVGQLFLARVPEKNALEDLKKYHLGGYLLFGRDVEKETPESLAKKIKSFQAHATYPLFIASDEEGGLVTRISRNQKLVDRPFPSPQESFKKDGLSQVEQDIKTKLEILNDYEINLSLSPVADMSSDQNNFIYDRTLGQDVATTENYIRETVKTMNDMDQGSTLKHFPGYGDNGDSHTDIIYDERSLKELESDSIPPFKAGIEAGADSVLIAHNIVTAFDKDNPASLSPKIYTYLREELKFDGVIMTDDFDMAGLKEFASQEEAAIQAIDNGVDLILSSTYNKQIPSVIKAVKAGKLEEAKLDESVKRNLMLKYKLKIITVD